MEEVYNKQGELTGWVINYSEDSHYVAVPKETIEEEDTAGAAGSHDVIRPSSAAAPSTRARAFRVPTPAVAESSPKSKVANQLYDDDGWLPATPRSRLTERTTEKKPNQLYDEDGSKARERVKTRGGVRRAPILDPEVCQHRVEWLSTKGSNQYKDMVRCEACNTVISSEETEWWRGEKELRRLAALEAQAAKSAAALRATKAMAKPITASELRAARAEPRRSAGSTGGTGAPR